MMSLCMDGGMQPANKAVETTTGCLLYFIAQKWVYLRQGIGSLIDLPAQWCFSSLSVSSKQRRVPCQAQINAVMARLKE